MINWANGTWEVGDVVQYRSGNKKDVIEVEVFPGLYWYKGLGSGTLFLPGGTMLLNCTISEAMSEASRLGLQYRFLDSVLTGSFISVMG